MIESEREPIEAHARERAWALDPRIAYWAAIRIGAHATTGQYSDQIVPELTFMDALQRWE